MVRRWYQLLVDGSLVEVDPDAAVNSAAAKAPTTTTSAAPLLGQYCGTVHTVCHFLIATCLQTLQQQAPWNRELIYTVNRTKALICAGLIRSFPQEHFWQSALQLLRVRQSMTLKTATKTRASFICSIRGSQQDCASVAGSGGGEEARKEAAAIAVLTEKMGGGMRLTLTEQEAAARQNVVLPWEQRQNGAQSQARFTLSGVACRLRVQGSKTAVPVWRCQGSLQSMLRFSAEYVCGMLTYCGPLAVGL